MRPSKKKISEFFKMIDDLDVQYFVSVLKVEEKLKKAFKNKKVEFFWNDGCIVGIGTIDRKMKLIHRC